MTPSDRDLDAEAYIGDGGDSLVIQTPGSPNEWVESDLAVHPPDAGGDCADRWTAVREELEESR